MKKLALNGCSHSSLAGYLKALGAFKVLSKQLDSKARLHWEGLTPHLCFNEDRGIDGVIEFFQERYEPTPIVIPWSGSDFFDVNHKGDPGPFSRPPSKGKIIEAFLASNSPKLSKYRAALKTSLDVIEDMGLSKKDISGSSASLKENKARFMGVLRSWLPDEMVDLLDVAAVIEEDRIFTNTVLGGGGGNDGNLHFGTNYMQCLWLCLPDFEVQRDLKSSYRDFDSAASCTESLLGGYSGENTVIRGDTIGLYESGYVGGPNAYEGFEADALRNPWDLIFSLEGLTLFKGALSTRAGSKQGRRGAAFPFTARVSFDDASTIVSKETGQKEVWLPIWRSPVSLKPLEMIFSEGRAEIGGRQAVDGVDFMRAIASLGVDRGIDSFHRYGIVKGRVGGDNYHTAINLGAVKTFDKPLRNVDLFNDIDRWLSILRRACSQDNVAGRYGVHLRATESAITSYCRQGDRKRLQEVLLCLGRAEEAISGAGGERHVPPLSLSPRWVKACDDGSTEYRLACAVGSISEPGIGPIRVQMEPVEYQGRGRIRWSKSKRPVCWGTGDLSGNLSQVLQRRVLEGQRGSSEHVPLGGKVSVGLADVYHFLKGSVDEKKVNDLIWAASTVRWRQYRRKNHAPEWAWRPVPEMPRLYSVVKLLYLPHSLGYNFEKARWEYVWDNTGIRIPCVPQVLNLLKAGRVQEAGRVAVQRLVASGLRPIGGGRGKIYIPGSISLPRLAASLLIPVWEVDGLARNVLFTPRLE